MGNPNPARYSGIIQDEFSNVVLVLCGPLGTGDLTKAELVVLLVGM